MSFFLHHESVVRNLIIKTYCVHIEFRCILVGRNKLDFRCDQHHILHHLDMKDHIQSLEKFYKVITLNRYMLE